MQMLSFFRKLILVTGAVRMRYRINLKPAFKIYGIPAIFVLSNFFIYFFFWSVSGVKILECNCLF